MTLPAGLDLLADDSQRARQATMGTRVLETLRQAIVQLQLRPGNPLSEADIARRLGVSRQPVREAFIKLAESGLVEIRPQRGTFVRMISVREVNNSRFIREAIEVAIVRKAAENAGAEAVSGLHELVEQQRRIAGTGDNVALLRLDERFHQAIAESADCQDAWRVLDGLKAQMDRVRYLSLPDATPPETIIGQHERIAAAIGRHAPDAAEQAMHEHLREILNSLPKLARNHPAFFVA